MAFKYASLFLVVWYGFVIKFLSLLYSTSRRRFYIITYILLFPEIMYLPFWRRRLLYIKWLGLPNPLNYHLMFQGILGGALFTNYYSTPTTLPHQARAHRACLWYLYCRFDGDHLPTCCWRRVLPPSHSLGRSSWSMVGPEYLLTILKSVDQGWDRRRPTNFITFATPDLGTKLWKVYLCLAKYWWPWNGKAACQSCYAG